MLMGCSSVSGVKQLAGSLGKASAAVEESNRLNDFMKALKNNESSTYVSIYNKELKIPINRLSGNISADLIVHIEFSDGSKFSWYPIDNENIYLLLRE